MKEEAARGRCEIVASGLGELFIDWWTTICNIGRPLGLTPRELLQENNYDFIRRLRLALLGDVMRGSAPLQKWSMVTLSCCDFPWDIWGQYLHPSLGSYPPLGIFHIVLTELPNFQLVSPEWSDELYFPLSSSFHRKQVLGHRRFVISELFLQQVFKHPSSQFINRKQSYSLGIPPPELRKEEKYFVKYFVCQSDYRSLISFHLTFLNWVLLLGATLSSLPPVVGNEWPASHFQTQFYWHSINNDK